jgi:hypothetical protein
MYFSIVYLEKLDLVCLILRISDPSSDYIVLCSALQPYAGEKDVKVFLQEMIKSELVSSACDINGYHYMISPKGSYFLSLYNELVEQTYPKNSSRIISFFASSYSYLGHLLQHLQTRMTKNL